MLATAARFARILARFAQWAANSAYAMWRMARWPIGVGRRNFRNGRGNRRSSNRLRESVTPVFGNRRASWARRGRGRTPGVVERLRKSEGPARGCRVWRTAAEVRILARIRVRAPLHRRRASASVRHFVRARCVEWRTARAAGRRRRLRPSFPRPSVASSSVAVSLLQSLLPQCRLPQWPARHCLARCHITSLGRVAEQSRHASLVKPAWLATAPCRCRRATLAPTGRVHSAFRNPQP